MKGKNKWRQRQGKKRQKESEKYFESVEKSIIEIWIGLFNQKQESILNNANIPAFQLLK